VDDRVKRVMENKKWSVTALKGLCELLGLEKGGEKVGPCESSRVLAVVRVRGLTLSLYAPGRRRRPWRGGLWSF
jgi:hypothetical protein